MEVLKVPCGSCLKATRREDGRQAYVRLPVPRAWGWSKSSIDEWNASYGGLWLS